MLPAFFPLPSQTFCLGFPALYLQSQQPTLTKPLKPLFSPTGQKQKVHKLTSKLLDLLPSEFVAGKDARLCVEGLAHHDGRVRVVVLHRGVCAGEERSGGLDGALAVLFPVLNLSLAPFRAALYFFIL
jgi:hypothetical protein